MHVITLTTDFGHKGYYLAALKGSLLQGSPDALLVDISHDVKPYDIVQGAYILQNAYHHFPKGTLHVIAVNNTSEPLSLIAFQREGYYFIGPDNGIFSLVFQDLPDAFRLDTGNIPFPLNQVLAEAVEHLSAGKPLHEIGLPAGQLEQRIALQPVLTTSQIRGSVIYVDHYDNAIVNIREELFERVRNGRSFRLFFKRHDPITRLSRTYHDVAVGEIFCLFNDAGYLVIGINMGRASSLLGLKLDDVVQIDFY